MACAGLAQIRTVDSTAAPRGWPTSWARLPIPRTENPTTQAGSASASRIPRQTVFLNGHSHQALPPHAHMLAAAHRRRPESVSSFAGSDPDRDPDRLGAYSLKACGRTSL